MTPADQVSEPKSARELFGMELRRLRQRRNVTQEELASIVPHSRTLIATVEVGQLPGLRTDDRGAGLLAGVALKLHARRPNG